MVIELQVRHKYINFVRLIKPHNQTLPVYLMKEESELKMS